MKTYFAYTRVSTLKQGEQGVSLQAQCDAINNYARTFNLTIVSWFEEKETAAKRGRPVFGQMLKLLKAGKAIGVIIHKIDRSSRNLKDWADLGELIDQGIEVHFANERLDLHSRGGRLSADIQAVVASDYIRNLREETRKGFYGRINQGLYPLAAPLGYLDKGGGKPKEPDPTTAPLVRKAYELYGTGTYNLENLAEELSRLGLRNKRGGKVTINGLSVLLNNPFYIGLIRLKRTGETFPGAHQPLITKSMFDRVRLILTGKVNTRLRKHNFLFRRLLSCKQCGFALIGELQKGHRYYRCHTKECPTTGIREEAVEEQVLARFSCLQFSDEEKVYLRQKAEQLKIDWESKKDSELNAFRLSLKQYTDRLNRLTDAFIDQLIEKNIFEERKEHLLLEKKTIEEKLLALESETRTVADRLSEFLELAGNTYLSYKVGLPEEKRDLMKIVSSNRLMDGKNVDIELNLPFREVANRYLITSGAPDRDTPRTLDELLTNLWKWFEGNPDVGFLYSKLAEGSKQGLKSGRERQ